MSGFVSHVRMFVASLEMSGFLSHVRMFVPSDKCLDVCPTCPLSLLSIIDPRSGSLKRIMKSLYLSFSFLLIYKTFAPSWAHLTIEFEYDALLGRSGSYMHNFSCGKK